MLSFEKSSFMISVPLVPQVTDMKKFRALRRDIMQLSVARAADMYIGRHSFNILKITRLKFCNYSKVNREYIYGKAASARKPIYSRKECQDILNWSQNPALHCPYFI